MEIKEIKIEIPQGYEIDKEKSTCEKIVLKKIGNRPKTWEEYYKLTKGNTSIYANGTTSIYANGTTLYKGQFTDAYNEFSTKERAEQFIAIGKLMQLRDYWVKWYKKTEKEYVIYITCQGDIRVTTWHNKFMKKLTFPTEEMANDFINCFRDLIKIAYMR